MEIMQYFVGGWGQRIQFKQKKKGNKNMKVNKLNNESGRSMVEMLGVLAIIGVLSVISIYGYRQAMIKLKANEVVNFASMFVAQALVANSGECTNNTTNASLGMTAQGLASGVTVTLTNCPSGASTFGTITITNAPADTCDAISATIGASNPVMHLGSCTPAGGNAGA